MEEKDKEKGFWRRVKILPFKDEEQRLADYLRLKEPWRYEDEGNA